MAIGDFTTVDSVVQYLTTDPSAPAPPAGDMADGGIISVLITQSSVDIRTFLGRNILAYAYTDMHEGWGLDVYPQQYVFGEYPVTGVQSVSINGQAVQAVQFGPGVPFASNGYIWRPGMNRLELIGWRVPRISAALIVQYTAGYSKVPADIQLACNELVANRYTERSRLGVISEAAAGIGSTTYQVGADIQENVMWSIYRRKRVFPNQVDTYPKDPFDVDYQYLTGGGAELTGGGSPLLP